MRRVWFVVWALIWVVVALLVAHALWAAADGLPPLPAQVGQLVRAN